MQFKEGNIINNHYRLKKIIGHGGFSEVWLADDIIMDNEVALKVYAPGMGLDDDGLERLKNELKLVSDLYHGNILKPSYLDVYERSPYLVLPYCERGSAKKLISNISEEEVWHFLHDVASGLAYLHEQDSPIIHQDIKPDNILIDKRGRYLITDFGISTKSRSTLRKSMKKAESAMAPAYTPPERFESNNTPIKASDIWSLGATVYELLEGDAPFGDFGGLVQKGGEKIPKFSGGWSRELKMIVTLCLQKVTWDRPTAEQLVEWTKNRPTVAQLVDWSKNTEGLFERWTNGGGEGPPLKKKKRWRKYILMATGAVAVVLLVVFGIKVLIGKDILPPAPAPPTIIPSKWAFDAAGGVKSIIVKTNGSWDISPSPPGAWYSVRKTTEKSFEIVCERNTGTNRNVSIIVQSGPFIVPMDVEQEATPLPAKTTYIKTNPQKWIFVAAGGTKIITVETDGAEYVVTSKPPWCSILNQKDGQFEIVCEQNNGGERRYKIVVKSDSEEAFINVVQVAVLQDSPYLNVNPQKMNCEAAGFTLTQRITVSTNAPKYDVDVPENMKSWCSINIESATSFLVICKPNTGTERSGYINVRAGANELPVEVMQAKDPEREIRLNKYHHFDKYLGNFEIVQRKSDPLFGIIDKDGFERVNFIYIQASRPLKNGCFGLMNEQNKWDVYNPSLSKIASNIENLNNHQ